MKNINWINNFIEEQECIKKIKHNLSTQKGRITRQTKEQNKEKEFSNLAFDNIFNRLDKLEKKLFIKQNGTENNIPQQT